MERILKRILMAGVLFALTELPIMAQPGAGSGGFGDDPIDAPIDGGASLLAAAGVGYGLKRIRDAKKRKLAQEGKEVL